MAETALITATAGKNAKIRVEVTRLDDSPVGRTNQNISIPKIPDLESVWEMVAQISRGIAEKLKEAQAKKAAVEFGIEIGLEAGNFTAMLVKGSGKANVKITLEWGS
jgi:hypothetical protein